MDKKARIKLKAILIFLCIISFLFISFSLSNAITSWDNNLNSSLVASFSFEETGTNARNAVNGSNNATLVNGVTRGLGIIDSSTVYSAGSSQYASIANYKFPTGAKSVNLWVNATTSTSAGQWLISGGTDSAGQAFGAGWIYNPSDNKFWCYRNGAGDLLANQTSSRSNWHMVTCVGNSTYTALYVDGQLLANNTGSFTTGTTNNLNLGRYQGGGGSNYFTGSLDEILIYEKMLNQTEITTLFANGGGMQYLYFSNTTDSSSVTFTGNENKSFNITLPLDAQVTSARLNFSSYLSNGDYPSNIFMEIGNSDGNYEWNLTALSLESTSAISNSFNDSTTSKTLTFTGNEDKTVYLNYLTNGFSSSGILSITGSVGAEGSLIHIDGTVGGYTSATVFTSIQNLTMSDDVYLTKLQLLGQTFDNANISIGTTFGGSEILANCEVDSTAICYFNYSANINERIYIKVLSTKIRFTTTSSYVGDDLYVSSAYTPNQKLRLTLFNSSAPYNVSVNVGSLNSTKEFINAEFLTTTNVTSDFANKINNYTSQTGSNIIPITIHSNKAGNITLSSLSVSYTNLTRTNDLSNKFNSILNNSQCNGGTINATNCIIPINLHSDTAGTLNYVTNISYVNLPTVNLISPINNSAVATSTNFICNATSSVGLSNITIMLWNSTNSLVNSTVVSLKGYSNSTNVSISFNKTDTYQWNCLARDNSTLSNFALRNYTVISDIVNPITNLIHPTNTQWLNNRSVTFNCTSQGANLDSAFLYGNFTGSYTLNSTLRGITTLVPYNFSLNLQDGIYLWSCAVNKTLDATKYFSQQGNFTFGVDTIYPNITLNGSDIIASQGSQTILFDSVEQDAHLDSCKYTITNESGAINGLNNNVTFSCNTQTQATVTDYGNYNLIIYAIDLAGNENSTNASFFTSATTTGGGGGGGGGGDDTFPVIGINVNTTSQYSALQKEIVYAQINLYCSVKVRQPLAIADYSKECSLTNNDLIEINKKILNLGFNLPETDLSVFYQGYKKSNLFQGQASRADIEKYGLFTSLLGITNLLKLVPPSVDKIVFLSNAGNKINYQIIANKPLKSCTVIGSDTGFNCSVTGGVLSISYQKANGNFFNKIISGAVEVQTDAPSDKIEIRQVPIVFRVYNYGYNLFKIPIYLIFLIVILPVSIVTFIKYRTYIKGVLK